MKALQPGTTLNHGKYKIVQILGQGSFGITYLATTRVRLDGSIGNLNVEAKVAIKEFFMADLNSRSVDGRSLEKTESSLVRKYINKFHSEAENLSKLNHPNIVKVLEVFNENNTSYYVMEYIEGETLDDYIKRNGRIGEEEAKDIVMDICGALSHMHDHHMLHLDLKPKNVMRDAKGNIFLIDFGLAKQYNENGEPESSTTVGLGTRGYAPIEQMKFKSDGTMPATLDIYALGATFFKMLTGQVPPESSDVLNEGLPVPLLQNAGVSTATIALVQKAMAPLKKDRFQDVHQLMGALMPSVADADMTVDDNSHVSSSQEDTAFQQEPVDRNETVYDNAPVDRNETVYDNAPVGRNETVYDNAPVYYDEEEPSFFQKYWKYGVALLIPLLIVAGILLFSDGKDKSLSDSTKVRNVITAEGGTNSPADSVPYDENKTEVVAEAVDEATEKAKKERENTAEERMRAADKANADTAKGKASGEAKGKMENPKSAAPVETSPVYVVKEEPPKVVEDTKVYNLAELAQQPSFPGGDAAMYQWLAQNIKYPVVAIENGIQGSVVVQFVVEKDGSVNDVKVVRSKDPALDKEALRVVRMMPKWSPGKKDGRPVRIYYTMPVKFALQ